MKKILVIWLVLVFCSSALACNNCDKYWRKRYQHRKYEQKYRFRHEVRETKHRGRLRAIRAKQGRRYNRRRYRGYYPSMYSMRACPY